MKSTNHYQGLSFAVQCFVSMFILAGIYSEACCQTPGAGKRIMAYPEHHVHQSTNTKYLEVGGGISRSPKALKHRAQSALPVQLFAEYGKMHNPLSYVAGFGFNKSFKADSVLLKPKYVFFHAKYSLSRLITLPSCMDVYGLLGVTAWRTRVIRLSSAHEDIQIRSTTGTGGMAGAGIGFNYQKWALHTQMVFMAGNDSLQTKAISGNTWISSSQLQLMLSYRFSSNGSHP